MELSCKSEYALLALLELTQHYEDGELLQIKEIATHQNIPDRYLEQLLATLRRSGLVQSQRGAKGGYLLGRPPWKITLHDVLQAIEGEDLIKRRSSTMTTPESEILYGVWEEAQAAALNVLTKYTLQDLAEKQAQLRQSSIMYYI